MTNSVGEIVRKQEDNYVRGNTHISKYVDFSMHDTLERIDAYLNSKHISGKKDSKGRDKPFFNICVAAANIWYRATDLDRKNIHIIATKTADWLDSFMATIFLRQWMVQEKFGVFLNEWGRVLARYGSAVVKFVESNGELHISVVPWNRLIVDAVDFEANPKIEILELTEADLHKRIKTHGYNPVQVEALRNALTERETLDKQRKDTMSNTIKLYEVHGDLPLCLLTGKEADEDTYVQQMHVISFVGKKKGRKTEYQDFTLFAGKESRDPYMLTHLIKEDGRTLSIGSVENLFETQWMMNHSMKAVKDTLDLSSKLIYQTADARFVGRNVLTEITDGDIFVHGINMPLTQINNAKPDVVSWQNYANQWKNLGNEVNGISEAMLGIMPGSGTAWRQTASMLQESYALFELMRENKGLALESMLREWIIPHLKKNMDHSDEITAILTDHEITKIDSAYIKSAAMIQYKKDAKETILSGGIPSPYAASVAEQSVKDALAPLGNKRFFKPSDISALTWKEQFKDLEWEVEIDITGESVDTQGALATLNTALKLVVTPGFEQNPRAQAIVGKILEMTGAMSPLEYNALPAPALAVPPVVPPVVAPANPAPAPVINQ